MVIDEATATGLPIISSDGGALAETAVRPGVQQYPAGDVVALTDRLRDWLSNPEALARHAELAQCQSRRLNTWEQTAATVLTATGLKTPATATVFEGDWLALREPADHRARSTALTDTLNQWFQQSTVRSADGVPERPVTIVRPGGRPGIQCCLSVVSAAGTATLVAAGSGGLAVSGGPCRACPSRG